MGMTVIGADEPELWDAVVARTRHDAYHLHAFHELAEQRGEGQAQLCVYTDGDHTIAIPLLVRPIDIEGAEGNGWSDATSVHGYAGPVSSHENPPDDVREGFRKELESVLRDRGVVSAFSRLNPFLEQDELLDGFGDIVRHGSTIAVELDADNDERRRGYRRDTRRGLRKLEAAGAVAHVDEDLDQIDGFIELYQQTMDRVDASPANRLSESNLRDLAHNMRGRMYHVICMLGGVLVAAGLYTVCRGIVHAHLGAARTATLALAPARLEIEMAITWARANGNRVLHLGGGLGASTDSLFTFKHGFGRTVLPYYGWQLVLDEAAYQELVDLTGADDDGGYFPAYRAPQVHRESIGDQA